MRIFTALVIALALIGSASAADIRPQSLNPKDATTVSITSEKNPYAGVYIGAELGGQFTGIRDDGQDIAAVDALTYGAHAGYNFSAGRIVFGPYVKGGFANGKLEFGETELLSMDSFIQAGGLIGYQIGDDSLLSAHLGYEWQNWEGLKSHDIDAGGLALGAALETMIAEQVSLGLNVDYIDLSKIEVQGLGDVSKYVDDTDAFRVTVGVTYRPQVALPKLF